MKTTTLLLATVFLLTLSSDSSAVIKAEPQKPNIVVILADDK
jgi:hypothetical protein